MDRVLARAAQVVLIEDEKGLGTGFFVGDDGLDPHQPPRGPLGRPLPGGPRRGAEPPRRRRSTSRRTTTSPWSLWTPPRPSTSTSSATRPTTSRWAPRCGPSGTRAAAATPSPAASCPTPTASWTRTSSSRRTPASTRATAAGPLLDGAGRLVGVISRGPLPLAGDQLRRPGLRGRGLRPQRPPADAARRDPPGARPAPAGDGQQHGRRAGAGRRRHLRRARPRRRPRRRFEAGRPVDPHGRRHAPGRVERRGAHGELRDRRRRAGGAHQRVAARARPGGQRGRASSAARRWACATARSR
jgi:hypothetical protein